MYYCTEHGKARGNLQISQSRIFFDPEVTSDENAHLFKPLKQYEVCIDMGDVISVQKKTLINESGVYVQDEDGRKSYMYDFFLQVDLASVNRKKNFNEEEESKDEETSESLQDQQNKEALSPSFINTHLGASMALTGESPEQQEEQVKQFLQKQALDELSKARPVATVFFRFSHRDDKKQFLKVQQQKQIVAQVQQTILQCQKEHTQRLVEDATTYGIDTVKHRVSQTFLNFFDIYSVIDQQAMSEKTKNQRFMPPAASQTGEGTFVLSIEAQKNIELMCQEGTPDIEARDRYEGRNDVYRSDLAANRASSIVVTKDSF